MPQQDEHALAGQVNVLAADWLASPAPVRVRTGEQEDGTGIYDEWELADPQDHDLAVDEHELVYRRLSDGRLTVIELDASAWKPPTHKELAEEQERVQARVRATAQELRDQEAAARENGQTTWRLGREPKWVTDLLGPQETASTDSQEPDSI